MFYVWLDDYEHKLFVFGLAVFLWWKHTAASVLVESFELTVDAYHEFQKQIRSQHVDTL